MLTLRRQEEEPSLEGRVLVLGEEAGVGVILIFRRGLLGLGEVRMGDPWGGRKPSPFFFVSVGNRKKQQGKESEQDKQD